MATSDSSLSGAATTALEQPLTQSNPRELNSGGSGGMGTKGMWVYPGVVMTTSGEVAVGDGVWDHSWYAGPFPSPQGQIVMC